MRTQVALAVVVLSAVAIPTTAQTFQPAKIVASRDSFTITAQGQQAGGAVISVAKDNPNVRVEMMLGIAAMGMTQKDSLVFNPATMSGLAAGQTTSMGMGTFNSLVTVADGHLKGTIARPGPGGTVANQSVDVPYTAGVLPDGAELALLPTVDFADGTTMTFKSFDPATGETLNNSVAVKGKENVTIAGAPVETWKVSVDAKNSTLYYITTAAPHRIVLIQVPQQGLEIRVTK